MVKVSASSHFSKTGKKNFVFAIILFFVLLSGFISFLGFGIWQNRHQSIQYHLVLPTKSAYLDKGFTQEAIEGVCLAFNFDLAKGECSPSNPKLRKVLSYAFPGSIGNISLIYYHLLNRHNVQGVKNFILPGFNHNSFVEKHVRDFEKMKLNLIAIDTQFQPKGNNPWPKNLWQFSFRHYFAAYHAGLYAAAYALTNPDQFKDGNPEKIGKQIHFASLGGLGIPPIYNFAIGFKLGVQMINRHRDRFLQNSQNQVDLAVVAHENIGGFGSDMNPIVKNKMDRFLNQKGVSIVFSIASNLTSQMLGSIRTANTRYKKQNFKHFIIGVDVDQGLTLNNEKEDSIAKDSEILTSAEIQIDKAVANIIQQISNGETPRASYFFGGHQYGTIPSRFQKTELWQKIKDVLGDYFYLNKITNQLNEISGDSDLTNNQKGKINQLINMFFSARDNSPPIGELDKALGDSQDFIVSLNDLITKWS